ncbi:DNA repair protein RecO [Polymorphobacter fuscus]|uniref:DNA repair protein RecO n=1 Tax=Sandarakinorhabdus fusca TaxID=1439888 RepID=A0A7C9GX61_9SPHN|nr:DNA repair protein RecO [Polymorphobacter fuscus]KAB7643749.1 DNA repair protein RecO [Polymorphobacter fuscus]MQT18698.1 DNA repair protein RecO [Polymorphobacter fuscus]NJC08085.1 DNA repair protein RecO (recombination protein O) [Polymorphobacter fuscus]
MHLDTPAIIVALLSHGEHGAVVRFLTPDHGLVAGYVRGGRSRRLRPVLQAGNEVALSLRARVDTQLAAATVELTRARAALATTAQALAVLDWLTALTATALAQEVPHPALYRTLDAIIDGIAAGAGPLALGEAIVRYEHLLLAELGFGLDLTRCAATGTTDDLVFVSPRSRQAVSAAAGAPYAARLLPLPALLRGGPVDAEGVRAGLTLTGHFLGADVLAGRGTDISVARDRAVARIVAAIAAPPA